ncbi:MAG: CorA family divalent cation transporter [Pseudomonadota bacterium]|nr:CorA family divalent cation transporter [Pseudomonadota bacterium]
MAFAILFDRRSAREIENEEAKRYRGSGFLWLHQGLESGSEFDGIVGLPEVARSALLAAETRPRCEQIVDGVLLNLRGLAIDQSQSNEPLSSIRTWAHENRVISANRIDLRVTEKCAAAMRRGTLCDPGDLVAMLAREISHAVDPQVADLGDELDSCEQQLDSARIYDLRRRIARIRSLAIDFRRFIAPDRDAVAALARLSLQWLSEEDRLHIREAADRFARMAEKLDAIRDRPALVHEQITDMRAEMIDQRSLVIAIVAFVFLPLTFVTGLLGMNVEGIPFSDRPWAFWGIVGFCLLVGAVTVGWFFARHWLGRG